jgi:hypothetical protein
MVSLSEFSGLTSRYTVTWNSQHLRHRQLARLLNDGLFPPPKQNEVAQHGGLILFGEPGDQNCRP